MPDFCDLPRPWWKFWAARERVYDEGPLHDGWSQLTVRLPDSIQVAEAWFNFDLHVHACLNRNDGRWYFSIEDEPPTFSVATRGLAMRLAERARAERPVIHVQPELRAHALALRESIDDLQAARDRLKAALAGSQGT